MKLQHFFTAVLCIVALFCQSCSGLGDDAFAHAIKAGQNQKAMSMLQPHHGKLQIKEINGKWYRPMHYAIANNDREMSLALIQRGSPTVLDGRSLAYNAARIQHYSLANEFRAQGYGTRADIDQAKADLAAARRSEARANRAALALGIFFIAALMMSTPSSPGNSDLDRQAAAADMIQKNQAARAAGRVAPYPGM